MRRIYSRDPKHSLNLRLVVLNEMEGVATACGGVPVQFEGFDHAFPNNLAVERLADWRGDAPDGNRTHILSLLNRLIEST
ncbi:MAG: hypothetical protein QOF80_1583 [Verrucomicrobiota bacterium]